MPSVSSQPIVRILLAQVATGLILTILFAVWQGQLAAVSALLGSGIAVIPNAFLAARLLSPKAGSSARAMLQAAWLGEIGKLTLTALLFTVVFVSVRPLSVPALFAGFIAAQLMVFGLPLVGGSWLDGKDGKAKS